MKKIIISIAIGLSLFSCQSENRIYSENQELSPEVEWLKSDVKTFKVKIDDILSSYNQTIFFRYAEGFSSKSLNVKVTEISPSNKTTVEHFELIVVDENGEYIGEPAVSIWDSEHLVAKSKKFNEKGTYTFIFEPETPKQKVDFAMEIGLAFDKN